MDTFRDTAVGGIIRLITGGKLLQYPDEKDPQAYLKTIPVDLALTTSALSRWTTTRNPELHFPQATVSSNAQPTAESTSSSSDSNSVSGDEEKPEVPDMERLASTTTRDSSAYAQYTLKKLKTAPDTKIVDWIDNDPADPQHWSLSKKLFVTSLICFLTFSIYIGSAIYTSGILDIEEQFHISEVSAVLGLTLFVIGYGAGPMFLAPLAEAPPIGRTPVYVISSFMFVFLNFGVVYASNLGMLLAFRFLTGFFGSPVLATGGSSLADIWPDRLRGYAIGVWGIFAVCGPVLGPLVGGFATEVMGWQWAIWELIWLNGFCFVLLAFTLPETSGATILLRRASRLRKNIGDPTLKSLAEIEVANMTGKDIAIMALWRPFSLMVQEPILLLTDLYLGLIYSVLYCWFEAFPIAFVGVYGFTQGTLGLSYLGLLVGAFVVIVPYFVYLKVIQGPKFASGTMTPEDRLPPAIIGSVFIPICLFWFGWTARASVPWIVPIIGSAWFSMGAVLLFNSILNYQGDAYEKYVGSALAGNDFARSMMGGCFPIFASAMFHKLGLGWACSLLGFISIGFIPIIVIFYKYGARIRLASKNAKH